MGILQLAATTGVAFIVDFCKITNEQTFSVICYLE